MAEEEYELEQIRFVHVVIATIISFVLTFGVIWVFDEKPPFISRFEAWVVSLVTK